MAAETKSKALMRGNYVIVVLAVLTAIEFAIAVAMTGNLSATLLGIVALIKAALIIDYFMHFKQLWTFVAEVWYEMLDADPDDAPEDTRDAA